MQIIDGKKVSAQVKEEVKRQTLELKETHGITPGLAVVIVGDDPASRVYVNNKKKACEFVGFKSEEYALPAETTQEELLNLVETLNNKKDINGILVQLPLPKHLDDKAVIEAISPLKDVDAFHAVNVGKIMLGEYDFLPCTPAGVMEVTCSDGKLYVSAILDCFNGEILALEMRDNMKKELCIDTLKQLKSKYGDISGAIFYSDRGCQYTSYAFKTVHHFWFMDSALKS